MGAANQFGGLATQALSQQQQLYAPTINYDTGLVNAANKGDYSQLISASGPALGAISGQFDQAKNNILNNTPAGPGQSAALAQLPTQQAGATASTLNQTFQGALAQLSGLGTNMGQTGLQLAGADLSGLSGAATTYGNVAQQKAQAKSSMDSLFGSIAGGIGTAAGGYLGRPQ